ncbi:MAG: transposase [Planctomycetes bacterium]|jgi:hypothetical protein|nr:transposase [Planctomycetota bacterium]
MDTENGTVVERRRMTAEEWEGHFEAQAKSGLRVEDYCQQNGITKHQFYYWKRQVRERQRGGKVASFVECRRVELGVMAGGCLVECPGGYRLHVGMGCRMELAMGLLEALRKCSGC